MQQVEALKIELAEIVRDLNEETKLKILKMKGKLYSEIGAERIIPEEEFCPLRILFKIDFNYSLKALTSE